ncbi:MAG: MCE family protein [Elusimicrobia bacterium]|nr:MCE family protein [Elusimicrobiota bacterium]
MKNEIKVGIFVLIGIVVLGFSLFMLGDFSFQKRYSVSVVFDEVGGLANKSNVKLNGVDVGKIKDIRFDGDKVIAEVLINSDAKIARNSKFYIAATSIIGSKFLQIDQGNLNKGIIKPGDTIYAINKKPLEEMITDVAENVNKLVKNIDSNGELARNLNDVVLNLRDLTANLNQMISSNSPKVDDITSKVDLTMDNIKDLTTRLDKIIAKIDSGDGAIGALVSDTKTKDDVKESISNVKDATKSLKDFMTRTSKLRTYWVINVKNEPAAKQSFSDAGVRLYVNDNRYYYGGLSNVVNIKNKTRGTSYEPRNTADAYMGWTYPLWEFYLGYIRGSGGFGMRYTPFYTDPFWGKLSLTAEANEFSRNRIIRGRRFNSPRYDLGLDYKFTNILSAEFSVTDILEVQRINLSAKVAFEDKDLATLFGLIGGSGAASAAVK